MENEFFIVVAGSFSSVVQVFGIPKLRIKIKCLIILLPISSPGKSKMESGRKNSKNEPDGIGFRTVLIINYRFSGSRLRGPSGLIH